MTKDEALKVLQEIKTQIDNDEARKEDEARSGRVVTDLSLNPTQAKKLSEAISIVLTSRATSTLPRMIEGVLLKTHMMWGGDKRTTFVLDSNGNPYRWDTYLPRAEVEKFAGKNVRIFIENGFVWKIEEVA